MSIVENKLKHYFANSIVASYIFSVDVNSKLEEWDITKKSWFLRFIGNFVQENKTFEILSPNANNNCKILINRIRFSDSVSVLEKEKCNELLVLLNSSGSENCITFARDMFINTSFNQKKAMKKLHGKMIEDSELEILFNTCCDVVKLLFEEDEQKQNQRIYDLSNNEFYFHCLCDLINIIPEILDYENYFSLLSAVLYTNSERMKKNDLDIEIALQNAKIKKIIKKRIND